MFKNVILFLFTLLFALPSQLAFSQQQPKEDRELKILCWNIYMLPRSVFYTGKRKRAREIAKMLPAENYDIIVFQEAFHGDARRIMKRAWKELYPHRIGPANRHWYWLKVNSGVWILSKFPLKEIKQIKYKDCHGFVDCFANKGALLVEGEFEGQKFQLLGTHIQAGGPDSIKQKQYAAIRSLIDEYREDGVPQILAGDFNMGPDIEGSYDRMLETLEVKGYEPDGELKYTASGLNDFRRNGNNRLIDFIFYRSNGVEPTKLVRNVRRFQSEEPWSEDFRDLSDHWAVEAIIRF